MEIKGLSKEAIIKISNVKKENSWIRDYRLDSYNKFLDIDMPKFGPKVDLNFDDIIYYKSSDQDKKIENDWNSVLKPVKDELDELGVLESEKHLGGMGVQYESEVIYHNMLKELEEKKVIFTSIEMAMRDYPEIVEKYFGKIVRNDENKFAALNGAVFSGGSFIYIPKNTTLDRPLQSYFRINSRNMGQFERTLIVVDEGASVHYVEGCTAPIYSEDSLHAAIVEIYIKDGGYCRYSTVQNWSNNIVNLVTKRALCKKEATMEWIDGNVGSMVNMKYPACILAGEGARGTTVSIAFASKGQYQDTGAKMIHLAPNTSSTIISKSICRGAK